MTERTINFDITKGEADLIIKIAIIFDNFCRASGIKIDRVSIIMDLTACHANGTPLDLERLLKAPLHDICHDVGGIQRHISRTTGQLGGCFLPRYHKRQVAA